MKRFASGENMQIFGGTRTREGFAKLVWNFNYWSKIEDLESYCIARVFTDFFFSRIVRAGFFIRWVTIKNAVF